MCRSLCQLSINSCKNVYKNIKNEMESCEGKKNPFVPFRFLCFDLWLITLPLIFSFKRKGRIEKLSMFLHFTPFFTLYSLFIQFPPTLSLSPFSHYTWLHILRHFSYSSSFFFQRCSLPLFIFFSCPTMQSVNT